MDEMRLKKRVEVFLENNIPVHLVLNDDTWLNGYIVKVFSDYFDFLDRKRGKMPIFYSDVKVYDFFRGDFDSLKKIEDVEEIIK